MTRPYFALLSVLSMREVWHILAEICGNARFYYELLQSVVSYEMSLWHTFMPFYLRLYDCAANSESYCYSFLAVKRHRKAHVFANFI